MNINTLNKYINTNTKYVMTLEEAFELAHIIANKIKDTKGDIDLVVGIANGAALMAKIIADDLNVPIHMIKLQRTSSAIKNKIARYPKLFNVLTRMYNLPIIGYFMDHVLIMFRGLTKSSKTNHVTIGVPKNVILVDDAISTGQSLQLATKMLTGTGATNITTAVFSWSQNYTPTITPDIYFARVTQIFPWSANSSHFNQYRQWMIENNLQEYI